VLRERGASASLNTLEQLVNVRAEWAVERALRPGPAPTSEELFRLADKSVDLLLELGRTPERLSLRGSAGPPLPGLLVPRHAGRGPGW
jgi:hypothetical protein